MRKLFLLTLTCILSATFAWAADVSVTEKFTRVSQTGSSGAGGSTWNGDVCKWETKFARRGTNDKLNGNQCTWITLNGSDIRGYIQTTNLEGGIKAVSFNYGQFGAEAGTVLKWNVSAIGTTTISDIIERDGDLGGNTATDGDSYSHIFSCKENAQLRILNASEMDNGNMPANGKARLLVNNITITPYLLYRNKDVTVGLKQHGYVNNGSVDFINNTGSEGTITFSSSKESVATVDSETGVVTPVSAGDAVITATWSEGASTSYTLHVVDGIIAENFSKVIQTGQTAGATWHGDLFDWEVANVRRGVDDTLGLSPRIQATAMRSNAGSTIISANAIEGGVKHLTFDWRQWGSATSPLTFNAYYSADTENWGDAVATQAEEAVKASESHVFDADIDNGAKGNAYLKLEYTSGAGVAVIGALKITPYLLYTTKTAYLDTRVATTYKNNDLINNTGEAVVYSIAPTESGATIDAATGEVSATDETEGVFTVKAKWGDVETTYTLTIVSRIATTASFAQSAVRVGLDALGIGNPLTYTDGYDGTIAYSSSNTAVATVNSETGAISFAGGVGQTTITATLPQTDDYKAASASYTIYVRDENARKEAFTGITGGVPSDGDLHDWGGDLFMWQRQYQVRRSGNDTIHAGTDKHQATSIGVSTSPAAPSILQSKEPVEGGIKYLSFYWAQWGAANNCTRRITVYADDVKIGEQENPNGAAGRNGEEFLLGINNAMKSNKQLIIKNESYKGTVETLADNASRIVLDNIHITPYLLYTNKDKQTLRVGSTYTRVPNINNITSESGTLTYSSSDTDIATVVESGENAGLVTGVSRGTATITAKFKWNDSEDYVTTTYDVDVYPVNCETFDGIEQTSNYANATPRAGDKATWSTSLGGFNAGECAALTTNLVRFRAPYQESSDEAYIQSTAIEGGIASMTFDWNLGGAETTTNWDIRVIINGREVKRLGNEDITATNAMDHFEQIAINDINEPGNFTIRFENHSTISGAYTSGNKARFLIDNITWTSYEGTKTLSQEADNSGWLAANNGQTCDVTISRSELVGGVWNTICLPFAVSKTIFGANVEVQEMISASMNGDVLEIGFAALSVDQLAAGTPYLIKPESNVDISNTYNKEIAAIASPVVQGNVTLQGVFSPMPLVANDYNTLVVGMPNSAGDNLFYPSKNASMLGFRAYFHISTDAPMSAPLRRARFVVNQKEQTTDVVNVQGDNVQCTKVLRDGQLFIIRDGKTYNAQGQAIK